MSDVTLALLNGSAVSSPRSTTSIGVNLAGLEFGSATTPSEVNVDYVAPTAKELAYYHSQGLNLIRLPFLWERAQPTLNGSLDPAYLALIKGVVDNAASLGMKVILDAHDYGGYDGAKLGDARLSNAAFADFWRRMATTFAGNPGLAGYDLMNEPNGLPEPGLMAGDGAGGDQRHPHRRSYIRHLCRRRR